MASIYMHLFLCVGQLSKCEIVLIFYYFALQTWHNKLSLFFQGYDDLLEQQHDEAANAIAELDEEEARQLTGVAVSLNKDFTAMLQEVDDQLCETLANNPSIDEDKVNKIIKLHRAEMKEFESKGFLLCNSCISLLFSKQQFIGHIDYWFWHNWLSNGSN